MNDKFPIFKVGDRDGVPPEVWEAMEAYSGKGRKPDARLIAIDNKAIAAIKNGDFNNAREAAKHFLPEYGFEGSSDKAKNNRIKDIAKRLSKKLSN